MNCRSREDFKVFEFQDDGLPELLSNKLLKKLSSLKKQEFRTPKADTTPLRKYQYLQTFSSRAGSQGKKMSSISFIDVETSSGNLKCEDQHPQNTSTIDGVDCSIKGAISGSDDIPVSCSISQTDAVHTSPDSEGDGNILSGCHSVNSFETSCWSENPNVTGVSSLGVPSFGKDQINCNHSEMLDNLQNIQVDVLSDDDESPTCSSDIREGCLEGSSPDHYSDGWERENMDVGVDVSPDYLIYKDLYCTDSSLYFLCSCIKVEGVSASATKESFSFEWGISDVIRIESQWFARIQTAIVKLLLRTDADLEDENPNGTSGTAELKFAVSDGDWFGCQSKIMSMDARYKDIWRIVLNTDANEEDPSARMNQNGESKRYFPIFDEQFEDVIYPKGDPDAVSISKRDVDLLQPGIFINDTIIDFFIKYLKNKISPEERNRFHFFNSFFFRKLADLDKNPSSATEGRAAFLRVRKWTRKVNLFEKDYVFIPVNFNLHWSLIVICHPGEIASFKDEEIDEVLKVPCILHMDSIKGSHKGLRNLVQSYLWEEWKERHTTPEPSDEISSKFFNLRFIPLDLPQQENSFDCGLFLLHYVEQFLEDAPNYFNPFTITKSSNFLNLDWFQPAEASLKRVFIQKLIYQLLKDHPQEIPANTDDEDMENNNGKESGLGLEFLTTDQIHANPCNGFQEGIQIKLLGNPDPNQFVGNSGLELKELFEPGTTSIGGLFPNDGQSGHFDRLMSFNSIGGDEERGKQYVMDGYNGGFNMFDPFLSSSVQGENGDGYVSSNCGSRSELEEMVDDENVVDTQEELRLGNPDDENNLSDSDLSEGVDTLVVEDSQEADDEVGGKKRSFMVCEEENCLGETQDMGVDEHAVKRVRVEESGLELEGMVGIET